MPNYRQVISKLPPPNYKDRFLIENQTTYDIMKEIKNSFHLYKDQAKHIADLFEGTPYTSARKIHTFLKNNIHYSIEPTDQQTSKSLSRYFYDRVGDCKHSALAAASILYNLGIPGKFRYVSYNILNKEPQHVYVVADMPDGEEIHIDPLQPFGIDGEKLYFSKRDSKFNSSMALSRLSGLGRIAKFSMAVPRAAYLLLIKANFVGIGKKAKSIYNKNKAKQMAWWKKIGGNPKSLEKAILKVKVTAAGEGGAPPVGTAARDKYCEDKYSAVGFRRNRCKRGKIDGIGGNQYGSTIKNNGKIWWGANQHSEGWIGVADQTGLAAVLVAAAPVLVSLRGLLKDVGLSSEDPYDNTVNDYVRSGGNGNGDNGNGFDIKTALPYIIGGGALLLLLPTLLKKRK